MRFEYTRRLIRNEIKELNGYIATFKFSDFKEDLRKTLDEKGELKQAIKILKEHKND